MFFSVGVVGGVGVGLYLDSDVFVVVANVVFVVIVGFVCYFCRYWI